MEVEARKEGIFDEQSSHYATRTVIANEEQIPHLSVLNALVYSHSLLLPKPLSLTYFALLI